MSINGKDTLAFTYPLMSSFVSNRVKPQVALAQMAVIDEIDITKQACKVKQATSSNIYLQTENKLIK